MEEPGIPFTFETWWSSYFPAAPGIYIIFDNRELIYIGESANVKKTDEEGKTYG